MAGGPRGFSSFRVRARVGWLCGSQVFTLRRFSRFPHLLPDCDLDPAKNFAPGGMSAFCQCFVFAEAFDSDDRVLHCCSYGVERTCRRGILCG